MTKTAALMLGAFLALSVAGGAQAHSGLADSTPSARAKLDSVPPEVRMSFSEPPTTDASIEVLDGCNDDVVVSVEVLDAEVKAAIAEGAQPGRWTVSYSVVSAVDSHATKGDFRFTVAGEPDCAAPTIIIDTPAPPPPEEDDDGSSLPLLVAGATVVIGALALGARMLTR